MKRAFALAFLLLFVVACSTTHPILGRWKTYDQEGAESVLFFKDDGSFEAISHGENLPGTWVLDEDKEPRQISLVFEQRTLTTIYKLTGDQLLLEPREKGESIPLKFSDKAQKFLRQ